jgi:peroxiredoxin
MTFIRTAALIAAIAGATLAALPLNVTADPGEQPRAAGRDQERRQDTEKKQSQARIGEQAPDFELKDLDGNTFKLSEHRGKIVVLEWFNPDCPYVIKHHEKHKTMEDLYTRHKEHGLVWVAINSGAPGKQGAGEERNRKARADFEMVFPLLLDEEGKVGRAYGALVSPHMYIIDRDGRLVYNGAIDNDRHPTRLGDVNYVDQAILEVLDGRTVTHAETRPYGCTVKYKN